MNPELVIVIIFPLLLVICFIIFYFLFRGVCFIPSMGFIGVDPELLRPEKETCPRCRGFGEVEKSSFELERDQLRNPNSWTYHKTCPVCNGEGEVNA